MNYLTCLLTAWKNYEVLAPRLHRTFKKKISSSLFTSLRHSNRELSNHSASQLKNDLENNDSKQIVIEYLLAHPPTNKHSFSSYLIDELMDAYPDDGWELFEYEPVIKFPTHTIPLYRGIYYDPVIAFNNGIKQHSTSTMLEPYTSSQNGGIGNSTSLNYTVAFDYAAPKMDGDPDIQRAQMHCKKSFGSSYVYVIHYRGEAAIHIPNTHLARSNYFQYATCFHEDEVNLVDDVEKEDIYCAVEVERLSRQIKKIHFNDNYRQDDHSESVIKQYENHHIIGNDDYFMNDYQHLLTNLTIDNVIINLHELSKEFLRIKYQTTMYQDDINDQLDKLRQDSLSAFLDFVNTVNDQTDKCRIIQLASQLKIFSEHKNGLPTNTLFKTKSQQLLINMLTTPTDNTKNTNHIHHTRCII